MVNLLWAPVYVIELAKIEDHYARLRRPIVVWWVSVGRSATLASIFAIVTSFATDAQGIANNTVLMVVAYLSGGGHGGCRSPGFSRASSANPSNGPRTAGSWSPQDRPADARICCCG